MRGQLSLFIEQFRGGWKAARLHKPGAAIPVERRTQSLELDHHGYSYAAFILAQVRTKTCGSSNAGETRRRRQSGTGRKSCASYHRSGSWVRSRARGKAVARRDPAGTRKIRHVGVAIAVLPAEGNVLFRHPVKGDRAVPGFVGVARVLGEVGRAGDRIGTVDGRKQCQVTSRIADRSAADRESKKILLEPHAVVEHPARESLLAAGSGVVVAIGVFIDGPSLCADEASAAAIFTAQVAGERKRHLVERLQRTVVVLDLNAVVGVDSRAAEVPVTVAQIVFPHAIVIEDKRKPLFRTV